MTSPTRKPARHAVAREPLHIAMLGTPPTGGSRAEFDGAVGEIAGRLAQQGHHVTVYRRPGRAAQPTTQPGVRTVTVAGADGGGFARVASSTLSAAHVLGSARQDVTFLFNPANAPLIPLLRSRSRAVAVQVADLPGQREHASRWALRYHRKAEELTAREADAVIADARGIADHFDEAFRVPSEVLGSGARILRNTPSDALEALGLVPQSFHLVVAPFVPEHHVDVIVEGFSRCGARLPLVVLGSGRGTTGDRVTALAGRDPRIRLLGPVDDARLLDQLYAHALSSLHGRSLSGTDPSLLRAMGGATAPVLWDAPANREVAGTAGLYFRGAAQLAGLIEEVERYPFRFQEIGDLMRERARSRYDWNVVGEGYDLLARKLASGYSTRGRSTGRRHGRLRSASALPEREALHA
jgi:glycosyltransferase involved in cell wall biosynthesis